MSNIPGESWFPVTGNLILKGNKPIASVPDDKDAYAVMEALTKQNKGVQYSCISNSGCYCSQVDEPKSEEEIKHG